MSITSTAKLMHLNSGNDEAYLFFLLVRLRVSDRNIFRIVFADAVEFEKFFELITDVRFFHAH